MKKTLHPSAPPFSAAPETFSDWLFAQNCNFVFASGSADDLPDSTLPELAVVGRSNVGKSSLLNMLTNRKSLARTSHTPGRTRQINFFDLGGRMRLVDLPGYGYAKVSRDEHAVWERMMLAYLVGRVSLRQVLLLVDGRHGVKESDRMMMGLLDEAAVPYRVVLTKGDKMGAKTESEKMLASVRAELIKHPAAWPEPMVCSSVWRSGQQELRAAIVQALGLQD
jgi:GTP-binding protein